ncbi:MAG: ATP phosphoribosyltransferase [bacterium]
MVIKLGIPKGSLEKRTIELFAKAGYKIAKSERSYFPKIDDREIEIMMVKAQEMPRYVSDGILDVGLCGRDWVIESGLDVVEICELSYSKETNQPVRWVLAVPKDSSINRPGELEGKRIATELVQVTKKYLKDKGINANVEFSWGATEAKPLTKLADAVVELTETGTTLEAHNLKVIDTVLTSTTILIANKEVIMDEWKKNKTDSIILLLKGALEAEKKVGLKMNIHKDNLPNLLDNLPSLKNPTISQLTDPEWLAIETIIDEEVVRRIIPALKVRGAEGIVEYPLNKVIP